MMLPDSVGDRSETECVGWSSQPLGELSSEFLTVASDLGLAGFRIGNPRERGFDQFARSSKVAANHQMACWVRRVAVGQADDFVFRKLNRWIEEYSQPIKIELADGVVFVVVTLSTADL